MSSLRRRITWCLFGLKNNGDELEFWETKHTFEIKKLYYAERENDEAIWGYQINDCGHTHQIIS